MMETNSDDDCVILEVEPTFAAANKTISKPVSSRATQSKHATVISDEKPANSASTTNGKTSVSNLTSGAARRTNARSLQRRSYSDSTAFMNNIDSLLVATTPNAENYSSAVISSSPPQTRPAAAAESQSSSSTTTVASFSTSGLVERAARDLATMTVDNSHLRERFIHLVPFSFRRNEYDIVLLVDTQEISGSGIGGGRSLVTELITAGLQPGDDWLQRRLPLGDFLWVARERVQVQQPTTSSSQPSLLPATNTGRRVRRIPSSQKPPESRELVLDYIVERKRLDDLSQSICDGRFREQKARLIECGLRRPIYLVEKYAVQLNHGVSESNLRQAVIDTQIIDNFYIKETSNLTATAQYLALMTKTLKKLYANKTLHANYLYDQLAAANAGEVLDEDAPELKLITYEEFSAASRKQRNWTIKELWLRQLVQIKGMSWEKAIAIVQKYPTPARLFKAYDACTTEQAKQELLVSLKFGLQQRNVGKAISLIVYRIYNTRELPKPSDNAAVAGNDDDYSDAD